MFIDNLYRGMSHEAHSIASRLVGNRNKRRPS